MIYSWEWRAGFRGSVGGRRAWDGGLVRSREFHGRDEGMVFL